MWEYALGIYYVVGIIGFSYKIYNDPDIVAEKESSSVEEIELVEIK